MNGLLQREPIVLASQSAARAAILSSAGIAFEARPARIDEDGVKAAGHAEGAPIEDVALTLAGLKARRVRAPGRIVVGADQMLDCEGRWFDKPPDCAAARMHLQALRGRAHTLVTAVVCMRDGAEVWRHLARPRLVMRDFSDMFLDAYLAAEGEALLGSVGAYRLEGPGIQLFETIAGDHTAILGLPLLPLISFLRQHGVLGS